MNRLVIAKPSSDFALTKKRGERACGSCSACCKTHAVKEGGFEKPAGTWCPHWAKGTGCTIYSSRPHDCATFECEWFKGMGEDMHRPDHTKVVLDFVKDPAGPPDGTLQMFEVIEGGLTSSYAKKAAREALARGVVAAYVYLSGRRRLYIPPVHPSLRAWLENAEDRADFDFGDLEELGVV